VEKPRSPLREGLRAAPGVPEFHLHLGGQLVALGREEEAAEVFATGLGLAQEPDVRLRLLVEPTGLLPDSAERDQRLKEAMAPGGHLIAAAMARVMLSTGPSRRPGPRRADSTMVVHTPRAPRESPQALEVPE